MNSIVITSIFPPTRSIKEFSQIAGHNLYVVGDKKTPENWSCESVNFISCLEQEHLNFAIIKKLPWFHYARKMIGYLVAAQEGASVIIDTDDDNIPKKKWTFPQFNGYFRFVRPNLGFINVYKYFTDEYIWPRGFPLKDLRKESDVFNAIERSILNIGIWQGLADSDPDVDAIYRLVIGKECYFADKEAIVFKEGTICPFNSQNTAFKKELFPLLYLPAFVTFRFTDILRGLVAQPIMWKHGFNLGFIGATVSQDRNEHDYLKDFESELPVYLTAHEIPDIVGGAISSGQTISENLWNAYKALEKKAIVDKKELELLELWLSDLSNIK